MKIGIFDSGVGGLTIVRRLRKLLPQADLFYFADQKHVPYGERAFDELHQLLSHNLGIVAQEGVDAIAIGCNTSCAVASVLGMPPMTVPVFDLIVAGSRAAFETTAGRVGVLATTATTRARAYSRRIHDLASTIDVVEVAAPGLVPLIESGAPRAEVIAELHRVCAPLQGVQALVLGCSHYALLRDVIAEVVPGAALIDPAVAQAEALLTYARDQHSAKSGNGTFVARTNGDDVHFRRQLSQIEDVQQHLDCHNGETGAGQNLSGSVRV